MSCISCSSGDAHNLLECAEAKREFRCLRINPSLSNQKTEPSNKTVTMADVEAGKTPEGEEVKKAPAWHAMGKEAIFDELKVSAEIRRQGLTNEEAAKRLAEYGPNQLTEKKKKSLLERIWAQVANVLVGILVFVAVVSAIRAVTDDPVTNSIQVGIIVGVIT